jgi:ABC-type branched-subunit amino acid transport system substrate-binding protein
MRSPRLVLLLAVVLLACPKRAAVSGQEMTSDAASTEARRDLERARAEAATQPPQVAAERFDAIASRFGDAPASADALYEAAVRWRAARRSDRARVDLTQLLARFPRSTRAPEARYQLALLDLEAGRPDDALGALESIYDRLPPSDRPAAARETARSAELAHRWPEAARWRAEAARQSRGDARARELARATDHLDALTPAQLAQLQRELPSDSPLRGALDAKLAPGQARQDVAAPAPAQANPRAIGVAVPLSGRQKGWGEAILEGVSLALGDDGTFAVVVKDTRGEPDGAQAALDQLAAEGVIAALGGVVSAEAPRAASAAEQRALPLISLSRAEDVTQAGPFVFQNMLTARAQARALSDFAVRRRGLRRFALLWPQIPYGQELASGFWDDVDARGGEVRAAETYEHDRTTFAPLVKSMVGKLWLDERRDYLDQSREIATREQDPRRRRKALEKLRQSLPPVVDFDAIFIPDFARNVALIAPALAVEDIVTQTCDPREVERIRKATGREDLQPVQLLGANGWDDPALLDKAGKYVECAVFVDGFFAGSERPETKAFVQAFQARYGHPPSILEASAYDAARMIRHAVKAGASTREAVREQLAHLKAFPGATGELSFDERREVTKQLFFITVENGALRELSRDEVGAAPGGT